MRGAKKPRKNEVDSASSPTLDPRLVLGPSDLLPGDVLLYKPRRPNTVQSKIIQATGSPYTHAAIYLGNGTIADSQLIKGVTESPLKALMADAQCVAVLRTQLGFDKHRAQELRAFVRSVVGRQRFYDLIGVLSFSKRRAKDSQLDFIQRNFGEVTSNEAFAKKSFFCSAFVVACYAVVGLIGPSAQAAYPPDYFAPGHLVDDPTFGWLLGYLLPTGGSVPADDPILIKATLWCDNLSVRWWL